MTTVLLIASPDATTPPLQADLVAAGFRVAGPVERAALVREAVRSAPDVVLCWEPRTDAALFEALHTLQAQQPTPVLVFTNDSGVEAMQQSVEAGVDGWVVRGYGRDRLRPLVQLAQARFAHGRALRRELAELQERFEERKLVDRAKGILMRASQVSEDEAFRLLRTASMHGNQRVGHVSRQVIDTAEVAEAINRAGQPRNQSQRLVKLYALACARSEGADALMRESVQRVEAAVSALEKGLSAATYGDLLGPLRHGWDGMKRVLDAAPRKEQLPALDALADDVMHGADALVTALESSGVSGTVHIVNVCARQRMLSQRMAKQALLGLPDTESLAEGFEAALAELSNAPLSTTQIRAMLGQAEAAWQRMRDAAPRASQPAGRRELAASSEELLTLFDRLTEAYQHSMQVLMG